MSAKNSCRGTRRGWRWFRTAQFVPVFFLCRVGRSGIDVDVTALGVPLSLGPVRRWTARHGRSWSTFSLFIALPLVSSTRKLLRRRARSGASFSSEADLKYVSAQHGFLLWSSSHLPFMAPKMLQGTTTSR